ncbi:VanZ family protein [Lachnospiraceae bacterium ZAX-1]
MKTEHKKILRICSKIVFGAYIICLTYFLFFAESAGRTFESRNYQYNLILFKEIGRFIKYRETLGMTVVLINLVGNVAAFVPFGAIMPVINRKFRSGFHMVFLSFEFSLTVETIQFISKVGSFDVDDLLLNTIGGMIGYLCFYFIGRNVIPQK